MLDTLSCHLGCLDEVSFAHPNGPGSGTCFGCLRCFANRFRLPRGSQCQVLVASHGTLQVDERSFCGFSYPRGMQNLSVMESWEGELQILSTDGGIAGCKEVSRANICENGLMSSGWGTKQQRPRNHRNAKRHTPSTFIRRMKISNAFHPKLDTN